MSNGYNKDEITIKLSSLFDNLSMPSRASLIGVKIEKILNSFFPVIDSLLVAKSLLTQFGSETLLPKNRIIQKVIYSLSDSQIEKLSEFLGIPKSDDNWSVIADSVSIHYTKILKFFDQDDYFLVRKISDTRVKSEALDQNYGENLKSLGYPHSYQNSVKIELLKRIALSPGRFSALLVMPTGSGKTRTAIEFLIDFIRGSKKSNIFWIVDSPNLSEQSLQAFKNLWLLKGDRRILIHRCFGSFLPEIDFDNGTNVVFGAFDKINSLREANSPFYNMVKESVDLMIIDEAHFSLAQTYEETISDFERHSKDLIKIGLTATPMRNDDNEFYNLKSFFNSNIIDFKSEENEVIENPLKYLQENEYLAKIEIEYLTIPNDEIVEDSREFNVKVIERIKFSIQANKQIIIFALSKDHAIALNILLQNEGIKSECIIGDTSVMDRMTYFDKFQNHLFDSSKSDKRFELNVLVNYGILATGIDLPKVDELFLLRKFGNETTAMQVLGRALRGPKNGGNSSNKIVSIIGNNTMIADESQLFNLIKNMY